MNWTIHFAPLIATDALIALAAIGVVLLAISAILFRRGLLWRGLCLAGFLLLFLNPSLIEQERESVPDVAVIVVDRSPSQNYGERTERTERALAHLRQQIERSDNIELRIVDAPPEQAATARETRLFDTLEQAFSDVPLPRRAGAILLTDGQVHDMPSESRFRDFGPVHALLSGDMDERDRQLVILEAPGYGIIDQSVLIRYRVEDTPNIGQDYANVIIRHNGRARSERVRVNTDQAVRVTIEHGGQNIFDIEAAPVENEITEANNRAPIIVNGVRDRLRVLLVSGQPHAGGRTWRDILTADPGVDLVHFTILREPDKLDATPQHELSLIAFPFRELFEIKLYDFDLIIFDRYRLNRILPTYYFSNIARYVQDGGALLEASGPSFAGADSIYTTDLGQILPAYPTGNVMEQSFQPLITGTGSRHPVTHGLRWGESGDDSPGWGRWLRQVAVQPDRGDVLMSGIGNQPLLILDRVGEGRVAQLASDQIWLWSRGYEGGGPHAELLRRLVHWLMKEPELEENALNVRTDGDTLSIRRRTLEEESVPIRLTAPDGEVSSHMLNPLDDGLVGIDLPAEQLGVYTVHDGRQTRFAIVGELNPPELRGVITTDEILAPIVNASRGNILWLAQNPTPDVRILPHDRTYNGRGWIGLRHGQNYSITGVRERPFMPSWAWALALLGLVIGAWWMEGRRRKKQAA